MINTVEKKKSTFSPSLFSFKKKNLEKNGQNFKGKKLKRENFFACQNGVLNTEEKKKWWKKVEDQGQRWHTHTHTYTKGDDPFNGA